MATSNIPKGRRKVKGRTLDLNAFLANDQDAPSGFAVVNTRHLNWGDAMENEDMDDRYTLDFKKEEKVVLPTAPKAARGPDVDLSKVPTKPPFTAFLGNLPYDVSEDDIVHFFRKLQVVNVRLPRENGDKGRIKGFGYAEFEHRQDLIQALSFDAETLKNRSIKICLAEEHDNERRDLGIDRTMGDWRSDKREFSRDELSRNDNYSSSRGNYPDREPYKGRSSYEGYSRDRYDRNGERNGYGYRNDRDFGREQDRYDRRSNDRGYGFSDRGMNRSGGRNDRRDGGKDYRDSYGRDSGRDTRFRDNDRDFDKRPSDRYESREVPKERRKLQLAPRTKPIEPTPPPSEAIGSSSIFGGAKPVDTAAREREIEERLARERENSSKEPKDRADEARIRRFSTGSGMSNRSRRSSDSGPPNLGRDDEDHVPHYKPPIPRQTERAQIDRESHHYNTLPRTRQRCSSNSSTGSEKESQMNSKSNQPPNAKKDNYNNYYAKSDHSDDSSHRANNDSSYSEPIKSGFRNQRNNYSNCDNSRERGLHATTYEEPKPPVYTSANKFLPLSNDAEDIDQGSNSD